MKKTGIVFACILLGIALCISSSCKKEEEEISGDSGLLVQNETGFDYDIYFDGDFIGEVEGDESRSWSVPSGNHCVDLESTTGKDFDEVCDFPSGQTVVIKITPIKKEVKLE